MASFAENGQLTTTSITELFEVPAGEVATIGKLVVRDEGGSNQSVEVYIDNGGAAAGATNRLDIQTVTANGTRTLVAAQSLKVAANGKIYLKASTTGGLNWFLSGITQEQVADATTIG